MPTTSPICGTPRVAEVSAQPTTQAPSAAKPRLNSGAGISALAVESVEPMRTDGSQTSRTAIFAALGRAEQAKYGHSAGLPGNGADLAVVKLVPMPYRLALLPLVHTIVRNRVLTNYPGSYGHVYARTLYFDEAVRSAIADGAKQVVILGAGFDTRGIRLKAPGVTTFEVDLPATQAEKVKRLEAAGYDRSSIRFVPLDLDHGSLTDSLVKQGFDRNAKTCVIAEGLTFYIDAGAFNDIARFVRKDCGKGSTFAFDTIDEATANGTSTDPDALTTIATVSKGGEPFHFGLKRGEGETAKALAPSGLTLVTDLNAAAIEKRYGIDRKTQLQTRVGNFYALHTAKN